MKNNHKSINSNIKKGILKYTFFVILVLLIIFGSFSNANASTFKYSAYKWKDFYENEKTHWSIACKDEKGNIDNNCLEKILNSQKKFYTKFYKIMDKYEKKGLPFHANNVDDIILETVFFELSPSQFSDDGKEYKEDFSNDARKITPFAGVYEMDPDEDVKDGDEDNYDVDIEVSYTSDEAAEYFSNEKDTIKTLARNMVANTTDCYGVYGNPTVKKNANGDKYEVCEEGGSIMDLPVRGHKCADVIASGNVLPFYIFHVSRWAHDEAIPVNKLVNFVRKDFLDDYYTSCKAYEPNYKEGALYAYNDDPTVNTDKYFDFLSNNKYFDKKAHLQYRFNDTVLEPSGADCMTSDICDNSLESLGLYESYEKDIVNVRRDIIFDIIEILNDYGYDISYDPDGLEKMGKDAEAESARNSYYWPIGSDEIEERDGIRYADKEPASTEIISGMGQRENPITGEIEEHYGIDISGVDGETNVIAVYDAEVITVVSECTVGDYECNNGYGNSITLSVNNGDYIVYGHLSSIDSAISVGVSVKKGQVLGKVGSTGNTNVACLHYEVRKGGNNVTYSTNPSDVTDPSNPRPTLASGDFSLHSTSLTREEFISKLQGYCVKTKCSSGLAFFAANAGTIYDTSTANGLNPEFTVVRAMSEGFDPGSYKNNYWGIGCTNGAGASACLSYSSFEAGIVGLANLGIVKKYESAVQLFNEGHYAYIGAYWYNPGSWALGGCAYYPSIKEYLSSERSAVVQAACSGAPCGSSGGGACVKTTDEDQTAYSSWQVYKSMGKYRSAIFGL